MVLVQAYTIQVRIVGDGRVTGIGGFWIDERKICLRPVSFRLAPEHLILCHGQLRVALNEARRDYRLRRELTLEKHYSITVWENGGGHETRTRGLCRNSDMEEARTALQVIGSTS
jgi:hypothetical protein